MNILSYLIPTRLQRKLAMTTTQPHPPSGGAYGSAAAAADFSAPGSVAVSSLRGTRA